jgi:RNA polymerase sigma-70 factor (ECF subfamily)
LTTNGARKSLKKFLGSGIFPLYGGDPRLKWRCSRRTQRRRPTSRGQKTVEIRRPLVVVRTEPIPPEKRDGHVGRGERLVSRFVPTPAVWRELVRTIASLTRSSDAEDLLQAAYVKLEEFQVVNEVQNPSGFLVRAAVNMARDHHRRANVAPMVTSEALLLSLRDGEPLQDEALNARQRLHQLKAAFARLSPRTRRIVVMHRIEKLKYREISEILGISPSAVEKHIAKATLFLMDRIGD